MELFLEIILFVVKPAYVTWRCAWYLANRFGPDFSQEDEDFIESLLEPEKPCLSEVDSPSSEDWSNPVRDIA